MGEMITKPDANPIVFAVLNLFVLGCLGYFLMGQQKKAIISAVIFVVLVVLSSCTFGLAGIFLPVWMCIAGYDAYLLGQKLASGESIGMNENGLGFLDAIFKD